jgi:hypothetical protein
MIVLRYFPTCGREVGAHITEGARSTHKHVGRRQPRFYIPSRSTKAVKGEEIDPVLPELVKTGLVSGKAAA